MYMPHFAYHSSVDGHLSPASKDLKEKMGIGKWGHTVVEHALLRGAVEAGEQPAVSRYHMGSEECERH